MAVSLNGAAEELAVFLARLADKHADPDIVFVLRLAESALRRLAGPPPELPAVAVVGPTQTGKSTVVNILAAAHCVETSVLAAHTRRAAMVAVNASAQAAAGQAPALDYDAALSVVSAGDAPPCVLWDTPDFDSNASADYRQEVARICGRVDRVVLVLSKEKYADQAVWRILEALAPMGTPILICLNKCEDEADIPADGETAVLLDALRRRLRDNELVDAAIPLLTLPRLSSGGFVEFLRRAEVAAFRQSTFDGLQLGNEKDRAAGTGRLVARHAEAWLAPVEAELECHRQWRQAVATAGDALMARYRSDYIHHARHHDIAQKAILGLLDLLEIPMLSRPMSSARRVLTWPFRRLAGAIGGPVAPARDQELEVLEAAVDHCLLSLRGEAAVHPHPWWRALSDELAADEARLRGDFLDAVERYRAAFQPRIDRLSEELYERLQRNPVTLNTLRAARVSADAGGVLLAIKTGTLGLHDALFAPAVVSLTSYLTESAVGQYLRTVIARLKREQTRQVDALVREHLVQRLDAMQPVGPGLFGISEPELARARALMQELEP